jgi:hypothetical protein
MGATLDPFASPEARKSIEELQVWTGLEEDFLDIVPNAGLGSSEREGEWGRMKVERKRERRREGGRERERCQFYE